MVDPEGGEAAPPPHFFLIDYVFFIIPFCNGMFQNKAQIAREIIKMSIDPGRKGRRASRSCICVIANNLLRPPPPNEKPGSAPDFNGT